MNNVDKAMMLADEYGNDRFFRGADGCKYGEEKTRQSLRTHIEAMEADRVRLLEALNFVVNAYEGSLGNERSMGFYEARNVCNAAIAQSEAQS